MPQMQYLAQWEVVYAIIIYLALSLTSFPFFLQGTNPTFNHFALFLTRMLCIQVNAISFERYFLAGYSCSSVLS
jgi:hypothetical protein